MRPLVRSAAKMVCVVESKASPPSDAGPTPEMLANSETAPVDPSIFQIYAGPPPITGGPNWPGA
jgi:hypothetical protein